MTYEIAKFVHVTGIIMLMGNITATAIWKFFADRTENPVVMAFGQRLVTLTDWSLTFWGVILTIGGGYAAAYLGGWSLFGERWLLLGQALFFVSGLMWLGLLVPLQIRMARAARGFAAGGRVSDSYRRDSRWWLVWGLVATVPLVGATWIMVAKPA
jgi:uncharacterized membrane protein